MPHVIESPTQLTRTCAAVGAAVGGGEFAARGGLLGTVGLALPGGGRFAARGAQRHPGFSTQAYHPALPSSHPGAPTHKGSEVGATVARGAAAVLDDGGRDRVERLRELM